MASKEGAEPDKNAKKGKFGGKKDKKGAAPHPSKRPPHEPHKPIVSASGKEVRGIVRLAGRDLRGAYPLKRAITSVRGIGINLGNVISQVAFKELGVNEKTMVGELSEEEIDKLEKVLMHPEKYGIPVRMFNRRKDLFSGNDLHLIGSDLVYAVRQDIDHEKDANTWRGYRHIYGQKVRGQRTRSTGRTGMTVGVIRKSVLGKAGAAAAQQAASAPGPAAGPSGSAKKEAAAPPPSAPKKEEPKKESK